MNHIGSVINKIRCSLDVSRNKISKNICSEKYLYLIEKGDRTPSAEILRLFSNKLGVDLFEYYHFLDCADPIQVCDGIKLFNLHRRIADFGTLKNLSDDMASLPDFQRAPWKYELDVNRISYMLFLEKKVKEAIFCINELMDKIESKYHEEEFMANLFVLLSTAYQIIMDIPKATQAVIMAQNIVTNKQNIARYGQVIVTVKLNMMTLCHLCEKYDAAIEEGLWINRFQLETNSYGRANFTYYYLAYSYYKKGKEAEAFEWFEKCLYELLIHDNPISVNLFLNYGPFYEMLEDKRISHGLTAKIKEKYKALR